MTRMQGYLCEAEGCGVVTDDLIGTITLDLNNIPPHQALQLALVFEDQGLIDLPDETFVDILAALRGRGDVNVAELDLPMVEAELCTSHTLAVLSEAGAAEIPDNPAGAAAEQTVEESAEQQA